MFGSRDDESVDDKLGRGVTEDELRTDQSFVMI